MVECLLWVVISVVRGKITRARYVVETINQHTIQIKTAALEAAVVT